MARTLFSPSIAADSEETLATNLSTTPIRQMNNCQISHSHKMSTPKPEILLIRKRGESTLTENKLDNMSPIKCHSDLKNVSSLSYEEIYSIFNTPPTRTTNRKTIPKRLKIVTRSNSSQDDLFDTSDSEPIKDTLSIECGSPVFEHSRSVFKEDNSLFTQYSPSAASALCAAVDDIEKDICRIDNCSQCMSNTCKNHKHPQDKIHNYSNPIIEVSGEIIMSPNINTSTKIKKSHNMAGKFNITAIPINL